MLTLCCKNPIIVQRSDPFHEATKSSTVYSITGIKPFASVLIESILRLTYIPFMPFASRPFAIIRAGFARMGHVYV